MYAFDAEDGKYTFINNNGIVAIQRYGEDWRNESGDKALLSLLHEVEEMEKYINFLENRDFDTTYIPVSKKTIKLKDETERI